MTASSTSNLRRLCAELARTTWGERRLLLAAPFQLLCVDLALRLFGHRRTLERLERWIPATGGVDEAGRAEERRRELARSGKLLRAVARRLPYRADCLRQTIVLWVIARRRGIPAQIRFGVDARSTQFAAHAWLEVDDVPVLRDDPVLRSVRVFTTAR